MNMRKTDPQGLEGGPATSGDVAKPHPLTKQRAAVAEALLLADEAFQTQRDCADALEWVRAAAKAGLPLPTHIGAWLAEAIDGALNHGMSLDGALGLSGTGKANVPRARKESARLQAALARMFDLHMLGATIEQAAALVESLNGYKYSTLFDRYSRSGMGVEALAGRAEAWSQWDADQLRAMLAEYPDRPAELQRIKASIMGMYWKRGT